jgi:hypothetical protein
MAEVEIKRTNFFDGQFLKQGEFLDMDGYHAHMRRRLNFALFDRSGVLQITPTDLAVEVVNAAAKLIRVRAGAAIGMRPDLMEGKEIVLRIDQNIDLNTVPGVAAGDTLIVTIHYDEVFTDPSSLGGVTGDTRVKELAPITIHRNSLPGVNAANGEPFVRLGNVVFNSMAVQPPRDVAFLKTALFATAPSITFSPNTLTAGVSTTVTVTSSGGLNLGALLPADINIAPASNITITNVTPISPTSATITFNVQAGASAIPARTITITVGGNSASNTLSIAGGVTLTNFAGVNEPAADVDLKINGSGFTSPTTIQFSKQGGGLTPAVPLAIAAGNVAAGQIRIPMGQIPVDAVAGPVTVQSSGQTVVSGFTVHLPAVITNFSPSPVASQGMLTINGSRFIAPISIVLPGNQTRGSASVPAFPTAALGETLSDTQIVVKVPSNAGLVDRVKITTQGGTVQTATSLTVS